MLLVNSWTSLYTIINKWKPSMIIWILRWSWYRHCISSFPLPRRMGSLKWVIGLSGVFCYLGSSGAFEVLSCWKSISLPMEASLGSIFSKLLSITVKINAFPLPLSADLSSCVCRHENTEALGKIQAFSGLFSENRILDYFKQKFILEKHTHMCANIGVFVCIHLHTQN